MTAQLKPVPDGDTAAEKRRLKNHLKSLSDRFLECRTMGHAWSITFLGPVNRSGDADVKEWAMHHPWLPDGVRMLVCLRCHTERIDLCMVGYGRRVYAYQLVARQYRYPGDYAVPDVMKHRELLHEEMFARHKDGK